MTPNNNKWIAFLDAEYFNQWAVKNQENNSVVRLIHVKTEEEAKFLAEQLNLIADLSEAKEALRYLWRAREEKYMRGVNENYKSLKNCGWDLAKEVMRGVNRGEA